MNRFAAVDAILEKAVQEQNPPGVVVIVGHNGETVYRKAFGYRSLEPQREPMTMDTIFDMASLTKCDGDGDRDHAVGAGRASTA